MANKKPFLVQEGLDANDKKIINVAAPVADTDAVNLGHAKDAGNLSAGTLPVARLPALTGGDVTSTAGSGTLTLANTAVTATTYGAADTVATFEVDSKGRLIAATDVAIAIAPAAITGVTVSVTELNYLTGLTENISTSLSDLDNAKLNLSGGTMTGNIVMGSNVITLNQGVFASTDAVNKGYVDGLVSGLIWESPIEADNLVGVADAEPGSPSAKDVWLVSSTGAGAWSNITTAAGDVVQYQDPSDTNGFTVPGWVLIKTFAAGDRYGISMSVATTAVAPFVGKDNQIVVFGGTAASPTFTYDFLAAHPADEGAAVFVKNPNAWDFGKNFTFTTTGWIEFGGPTAIIPGIGLSLDGRTFNVNLGAGISQLPTDEVGVDVTSGTGLQTLILTTDGTNESVGPSANARVGLKPLVGSAGSYNNVTVDDYGRVTTGSTVAYQAEDAELTAIAALGTGPGYIKKDSAGNYSLHNDVLTGNVFVGTPGVFNTVTVQADGRVIAGSNAGSAISLPDGNITSATHTAVGTTAEVVDSFPATTYRTVEYLVSISDTATPAFHSVKVLLMHDNTATTAGIFLTEYAVVMTGTPLGDIDAQYNSGTDEIELTVDAGAAGYVTKVVRLSVNA